MKKKIQFPILADIISNNSQELNTNTKNQFFQQNYQYYSKLPNGSLTYDYNAYIRRMEDKIKQSSLEEHIIIQEGEEILIKEVGYTHNSKNKILVKNLIVENTPNNVTAIHFGGFIYMDSTEMKYTNIKYSGRLIFEDNEFIGIDKTYFSYIQIIFLQNSYIHFERNKFINVDIYSGGNAESELFMIMKNNIFENRHSTLSCTPHISSGGFVYDGVILSGDCISMLEKSKYFEERINEKINKPITEELSKLHDRVKNNIESITLGDILLFLSNMYRLIRVKPDNLHIQEKNESCIILDSNSFTKLDIVNTTRFYLKGKNIIDHFVCHEMGHGSYIGPYQEVDKKGTYAEHNKETFLKLQAQATERNDYSQARVCQLEIKKCEHHILRKEKLSLSNFQDRVIMGWGHWVSRHSTSWMLPIFWLVALNFILAYFIVYFCQDNFNLSKLFITFFELFNPTSTPAEVLYLQNTNTPFLSFINIFQKIFFALLAYETIKAFRRFALK